MTTWNQRSKKKPFILKCLCLYYTSQVFPAIVYASMVDLWAKGYKYSARKIMLKRFTSFYKGRSLLQKIFALAENICFPVFTGPTLKEQGYVSTFVCHIPKGKQLLLFPVGFSSWQSPSNMKIPKLLPMKIYPFTLALLHLEQPKLHGVLAILSSIGLNGRICYFPWAVLKSKSNLW